jgi:hypothetical protein
MTRFLSQALNDKRPSFGYDIADLETANNHPDTDIRLTSEVMNAARVKCQELGLDPKDTTAEELYAALQARVKQDDKMLTRTLRTLAARNVSAEADPVAGMVEALKRVNDSKACFALKTAKLKSLLKALPPKKTMKLIGYRSVDSMLKHESVIEVLAAAWMSESMAWRKKLLDQYKKLKSTDFEERNLRIIYSTSKNYQKLGKQIVEVSKHNILSLKELGAVVLLPLPEDAPDGAITASLSLALHEMNEVRVASSFLKINQVKPNFGEHVVKISLAQPELETRVFDRPVPWGVIQRYYSKLSDFEDAVFEPYVRLEDMVWHPIEETLTQIEPGLSFWHGTDSLGLMDKGATVSLNLMDNALSLCNKLPFENRIAQYFENSLWHELLIRYMSHESIQSTVINDLHPAYAYAEAEL